MIMKGLIQQESTVTYFIGRLSFLLAAFTILVMLSGCLAIPLKPPGPQIQNLSPVGEEGAIVIISRKNEFTGGYCTIYIFLDKIPVAQLDNGQFTKFLVSPGPHTLSIQWKIGGVFVVAGGPYGGGAGVIGQAGPFQRKNQEHFKSNKEYLFTIQAASASDLIFFKIDEDQRFIFSLVDKFEEPFALEDKEFIPPGKKQ